VVSDSDDLAHFAVFGSDDSSEKRHRLTAPARRSKPTSMDAPRVPCAFDPAFSGGRQHRPPWRQRHLPRGRSEASAGRPRAKSRSTRRSGFDTRQGDPESEPVDEDSRRPRRLAAVVLHVSGYDLPVLSVPSVHMTAIWPGPIAVPSLALVSRTCLEGGVAALAETRLALHGTDHTTTRSGANNRAGVWGGFGAKQRTAASPSTATSPVTVPARRPSSHSSTGS